MAEQKPIAQDSERWASLDLRSLAFFRIALGSVLLLDLLSRFPDIESLYSDRGVFPRLLFAQSAFADDWLCFHLGFGSRWGFALILTVQCVLALALTIGWQTRGVTVGSWILLNSLHLRNPFVHDRGDLELALLLFWSIFLPLGARWSLDQRAGRSVSRGACGIPAAAFVLQIAQIYLWAGILKFGPFWLVRGDGLFHSLQSPLFATDLGLWFSKAPSGILLLLNYSVVAAEIFVGFLLLCPKSVSLLRTVAIVLVVSFHLGVMLLFQLGLFPLVGIVGVLALLPGDVWKMRPFNKVGAQPDAVVEGEPLPRLVRYFLVLCVFLTILSNAALRPSEDAFQRPSFLLGLSQALRLEQHWDLFSPIPPYNGHFEIVDHSGHTLYRVPSGEQAHDFLNHRWRMLMISSLFPAGRIVRPGIVRELVSDHIDSAEVSYLFVVRLVNPDGKSNNIDTWTLWTGTMASTIP